jgi:hypothetical protein
VEDIRAWIAGAYVPNPSPEEFSKQQRLRFREMTRHVCATRCMVPPNHPSRQEKEKN